MKSTPLAAVAPELTAAPKAKAKVDLSEAPSPAADSVFADAPPKAAARKTAAADGHPGEVAFAPTNGSALGRATTPPIDAEPITVSSQQTPELLRELVLAWFEARGYRPVPALPSEQPLLCVLRHKSDPLRAYGFAASDGPLATSHAREVLRRAQQMEVSRVLIACAESVDAPLAEKLARQGIRTMDWATIDREIGTLDEAMARKLRLIAQRRVGRAARTAHA
jgi:uroporphyrinogen-III synthase